MSRVKKRKIKKRIQLAEKTDKKPSKAKMITIFIAAIMVLSVFGVIFGSYNSPEQEMDYGDFQFQRTENQWVTEIDGQQIYFDYNPSQVDYLEISPAIISRIQSTPMLYVTFDPNVKAPERFDYVRFKLSDILAKNFNIYAISGMVENSSLYQLPVIGCENASASVPVLYLKGSNTTGVIEQGNCIIFESDVQGTIALNDRLLFGLFGVMR